MLPDLAYLVHEADNELLRYSLRSIDKHAQGAFRSVWIVGVLPDWIRNVGHIPAAEPERRDKFTSIRTKVEALAADGPVQDHVVILNDDYIATAPVTWEPTHMGPTSAYLRREAERGRTTRGNSWIRAVHNTAEWMSEQGHGDIDCYEGHVPLMFDRVKLAAVLAAYPADRSCDYPSFYPAAGSGGPGVLALNAKIGPTPDEFHAKINHPDMPHWISTNDRGFDEGMIGGYIRGMLREPSQYEVT